MTGNDFIAKRFKQFIAIAPLSHAFWRTTEALAFDGVVFQKPVLDLGCGFGEFAGVVFEKMEIGIDINKRDLMTAAITGKYNKVLWADARKLPFSDSKFQTVVSVSVLEHIPETKLAIREVKRVLKKSGLFILTVPTTSLDRHLLLPKICRYLGLGWLGAAYVKMHRRLFNHRSWHSGEWWTRVLENEGFSILTEHGTVSRRCLWLHELFLLSALPSQITKWVFGKRLVILKRIRQIFLPVLFSRFLELDKKSEINLFIIARKN